MEQETICFPAPLNDCFPLNYLGTLSIPDDPDNPEDEIFRLLKENAPADCYLSRLDGFSGEDWD
jgi:hypothetical protein